MKLDLRDHVVLVTGASRGLGAAVALGLAEEGARVVATARSKASLEAVESQGGGRIVGIAADMRSKCDLLGLVRQVTDRFGCLDSLVNNAGIAPAGRFVDQSHKLWDEILAVNVLAPMILSQAAGSYMIENGGGRILNIASITGLRGKPQLVGYSASKAALIRMTEALAAEWASRNVQVNCIAPGAFVTEAQRAVTESPEFLSRRVSKIPAGRMADPAELVPLACLLVSGSSRFTTGATFVVDGGESGKI